MARREWVLKKGQQRNEALDRFVYNFVALKILNPNFEVLEKNMEGVEAKPLKKANKPYKIRGKLALLTVLDRVGILLMSKTIYETIFKR